MSKKNIKPENIKGVKAKFDACIYQFWIWDWTGC